MKIKAANRSQLLAKCLLAGVPASKVDGKINRAIERKWKQLGNEKITTRN